MKPVKCKKCSKTLIEEERADCIVLCGCGADYYYSSSTKRLSRMKHGRRDGMVNMLDCESGEESLLRVRVSSPTPKM